MTTLHRLSVLPEQRAKLLLEIHSRREKQDYKWGGASHDDQHAPNDWVALIVKHIGKAVFTGSVTEFREALVDVAALAVAATESIDRFLANAKKAPSLSGKVKER